MQLNEITYDDAVPIQGYGAGFFRVGGRVMRGATLVTATGAGPWGGLDDRAALEALAGSIDVLLVGTGPEMTPLPEGFAAALEELGIGVEIMASPSACRTYNMLLAEARRVAAALLPA